jgi:pyrroloquinoline quinone biosynthesis protein D
MQDNNTSLAGCPHLTGGFRLERTAMHPILAGAHGTVLLNNAAAAVLALCDGTHSIEAIVSAVAEHRHEGLAGDLRAFMDAARRRGWLAAG